MIVYVATKNTGKLHEIEEMAKRLGWIVKIDAGYDDVAETADTYVGNARLKAHALAARLRAGGVVATVIGDDSGIEVSALDGRPGIFSARYGPSGSTWSERRRLLLEELAATRAVARRARFVCAIVAVTPAGSEAVGIGEVVGRVAFEERGDGGFSYDAIFEYPPLGRTFAELPSAEKNALSHRARALSAVAARLAEMESGEPSRTPEMPSSGM